MGMSTIHTHAHARAHTHTHTHTQERKGGRKKKSQYAHTNMKYINKVTANNIKQQTY